MLKVDNIRNYEQSTAYLEDKQDSSRGFREVKEGSIFIYPKPTETVSNGLKMHAIVSLIDLVD